MLTSESITTIMPAFIKAQGNFAPALKQANNPHFKSKYVALDGVIDAVAAPLRAEGIAIMQMTDVQDARTILETRLIHASGEWIGSRYPVHPVKADPQGEGSALTYARRYALMALVGIAPEDDDGNEATKAANKPVTDMQSAKLAEMADDCGADVTRFCAVFGATKISEIPAAKYDEAVTALKRKAQAKQAQPA